MLPSHGGEKAGCPGILSAGSESGVAFLKPRASEEWSSKEPPANKRFIGRKQEGPAYFISAPCLWGFTVHTTCQGSDQFCSEELYLDHCFPLISDHGTPFHCTYYYIHEAKTL
jgi:hypothetical protein